LRTRWIVLHHNVRSKLQRVAASIADAATRLRYLIVLHADRSMPKSQIARSLGCCRQTVQRTVDHYNELGEAGLLDRREDNGQPKVTTHYLSTLKWILESSPQAFFHRRPTWTHQLLIDTAADRTDIRISKRTMGRVLAELKVRRGRPKPLAPCPWPKKRRAAAILAVKTLIETLADDEAAVWEDEADIDLNPRIGLDYMLPGTQRTVQTPGKNVKRYVAGAMDAVSDRVMWVTGERKNSTLFITMLKKLLKQYPQAKVIHVVCDNYAIHDSKQTRTWLAEHGKRLKLHFLPPYCPGRQSHRANNLAGDARQRDGEPSLPEHRAIDRRGGPVADEPQSRNSKKGGVSVTELGRCI
jgi:transposase